MAKGKIISKTISTIDKIRSLSTILSQKQIAEKIGVNQSTISRILSGKIKSTSKLTTRNKRTITNAYKYYNKTRAVGYTVTFTNADGQTETRSTYTTRPDAINQELLRFISDADNNNDVGSGTLFDNSKAPITKVKIDRKIYRVNKNNDFVLHKKIKGKELSV